MRHLRPLVLLLALASAGSKTIEAHAMEAQTLHYDIYYMAMRVVSVDVASETGTSAYRTTVALRTAGLLEMLAHWESRAVASGTIDGAAVRPVSYRVDSAFRERRQHIGLDYEGTGRVRGAADGVLVDGQRGDVPVELRDGTVDPVSASAALAQRVAAAGTCTGTARIFDGLRRYDLRYEDLGPVELAPSGRDPYRGPARHCRVNVEPIAGFLDTSERTTEISAWLAPPVDGAPPVAVRMDLAGTRGTLHVHLARATPGVP